MSMKPNYFKIGMFTVVAVLLILVALVVFGAGLLPKEQLYFETYFDGSVTGLSTGAPVELRGVRIGQVERIAFVQDVYEVSRQSPVGSKYESYVMVLCSVPKGKLPDAWYEHRVSQLSDMVSRGLRARLASNLLTEQAYLQADYIDPNRFPMLEVTWKPKHLYMPSAPGEFTTLKESVDKVLLRLQELDIDKLVVAVEAVLTSMDSAISDANVGEISRDMRVLLAEARTQVNNLDTKKMSLAAQQAMASVDQAVADVNTPAISQDLLNLIAGVHQTNEHLQELLASPQPLSEPANLPEMVARLNRTLSRIDRLLSTERPQIEIILANFKEISDNLKDLTESLKQHPSGLLFSQPPSPPEVSK